MGQRNKKRTARSMGIVCSCLIVLITNTNVLADDQTLSDPYYNLIYDFEVAQFCGLVSKRVHDAFWRKRNATEAQSQRSIEQLRRTRISAMAAADIEYANRGLGGYKPWCKNEGKEGIARIVSP